MGASRLATLHWLASDLADVQERCRANTCYPAGHQRLPHRLDRELRALAGRLTGDLNTTVQSVLDRTLAALPGGTPTREVRDWVADEVRAAVNAGPHHVLLVTSTAGVATPWGADAPDGSSADGPIVRPVRVVLTPGCYLLWRERANIQPTEADIWLGRALDSVAAALLAETVTRYHEVHSALTLAVAELDQGHARPAESIKIKIDPINFARTSRHGRSRRAAPRSPAR
jgi:hypothetical protein